MRPVVLHIVRLFLSGNQKIGDKKSIHLRFQSKLLSVRRWCNMILSCFPKFHLQTASLNPMIPDAPFLKFCNKFSIDKGLMF